MSSLNSFFGTFSRNRCSDRWYRSECLLFDWAERCEPPAFGSDAYSAIITRLVASFSVLVMALWPRRFYSSILSREAPLNWKLPRLLSW